MLAICTDILPNSELSYLAFRVSFQETLERIVLSKQMQDEYEGFGYLTEVPFLRSVSPHIQLELLSETWRKHVVKQRFMASLIDESIVYAVFETAAQIVEKEPTVITHCLISGPRQLEVSTSALLAAELRNLHLSLSNNGDFLLISQFEDMHPDEARKLKRKFGLNASKLDRMFDVLGRWTMSDKFIENLDGLLTDREISRTAVVLGEELSQSLS